MPRAALGEKHPILSVWNGRWPWKPGSSDPLEPLPFIALQIGGLSTPCSCLPAEPGWEASATGPIGDCFPARKNPPRPLTASLDTLQNTIKGCREPLCCKEWNAGLHPAPSPCGFYLTFRKSCFPKHRQAVRSGILTKESISWPTCYLTILKSGKLGMANHVCNPCIYIDLKEVWAGCRIASL